MNAAAELAEGIAQIGFPVPPEAHGRLLDYLTLLHKWNRTYNLTAVRETPKMVTHLVLDSLIIAPYVTTSTLLDVGSGAGLPGIPLALALPGTEVTLLEASQKKAAFLRQAKAEMKLDNVSVVCERVEAWNAGRTFGMVISRALSDLAEFVALAGRHVAPGGRLAAMKGVYPHAEISQLPPGWRLQEALALVVPGLQAQRHLLLLEPE